MLVGFFPRSPNMQIARKKYEPEEREERFRHTGRSSRGTVDHPVAVPLSEIQGEKLKSRRDIYLEKEQERLKANEDFMNLECTVSDEKLEQAYRRVEKITNEVDKLKGEYMPRRIGFGGAAKKHRKNCLLKYFVQHLYK